MYAILDIETTGGNYNEEGITEIAIYKFDGHKIVDQFISLINPERKIQDFVVNLTGINNAMLKNAPKFHEVAKRIVEITKNCIIVAHNAQFDFRILSTEFSRLGFDFNSNTLCTVALSKKLIPNQESYSLGKLVRSLGIPLSNRHRAQGDAIATLTLFKLLLAKDKEKKIISASIKNETKKELEPKLVDILATLPEITGVYYIHRANGSIIYIGKSRNIKKRLRQHFTNDNRKSKEIQFETHAVSYEETGSDLIAQLKEVEEIKINKPKFNRALKKTQYSYQLISELDKKGYQTLKLIKADSSKKAITSFTNKQQAKESLNKITETYKLCQKLTELHKTEKACFLFTINQCEGACIEKESPKAYNKRVQNFIDTISFENKSLLIIDKGRDIDERSVIHIEEGQYKGFGFYNLNYQINNAEVLKTFITPMNHNRDVQHIIQNYLRKKKVLKIIDISN